MIQQPLAPRQKVVLDFVRRFVARHHYSPSFRDIQDGLKFASPNAVAIHLAALERKGWITTQDNQPRTIVVTPEPGCCHACGQPLERK